MNSGHNGEFRAMSDDDYAPLPPMTGWKLWYEDGAAFSSDAHGWDELPVHGVQVLMTYHGRGRQIWTGWDSYVIPGSDTKLGKEIDPEVFESISLVARDDAWGPGG